MASPPPPPTPPTSTGTGRLAAYRQTLAAISKRTGAPLPSLLLSFGILHELTAIVPLVGVFYAARTLGVGENVVGALVEDSTFSPVFGSTSSESSVPSPSGAQVPSQEKTLQSWGKQKIKTWIDEGDRWAVRVGRRYGIFGYTKRAPGEVDDVEALVREQQQTGGIAGDVANAVLAYGVTKALIPLRIGLSVYLSPAFSRGVVEPIRKTVMRPFSRRG